MTHMCVVPGYLDPELELWIFVWSVSEEILQLSNIVHKQSSGRAWPLHRYKQGENNAIVSRVVQSFWCVCALWWRPPAKTLWYSDLGKSEVNPLNGKALWPSHQCTICCLHSMLSFQPNKLNLKFMCWYTIQHLLVPPCSVGWKPWFSRKP